MKTAARQQQVFVVDDDEAVLDSIRLRLLAEGITGQYFGSAEQLFAAVDEAGLPLCIVADVRLPGMTGVELQAELTRRKLDCPLVLITGHGEIDMAVRAIKEGAFDFFEKPFDPVRLIASVKCAIEAAGRSMATQRDLDDLKERVSLLSPRQRQVMDLAVLGFSNKEIAQQMGISPRTVESYRAWVMEKTGAANLAELVRASMRLQQ
ncbi:MAG: response regulator transcription factor [Proteobacteria bacterium]|nr:response regulator transcription factor [Pseudomonadota bacterium]